MAAQEKPTSLPSCGCSHAAYFHHPVDGDRDYCEKCSCRAYLPAQEKPISPRACCYRNAFEEASHSRTCSRYSEAAASHKDEAAIQQRRLTAQQDPQPAGGARVYLAAVIEAYDEFTQIIASDIELYPIDASVEQARQYMIEAQ